MRKKLITLFTVLIVLTTPVIHANPDIYNKIIIGDHIRFDVVYQTTTNAFNNNTDISPGFLWYENRSDYINTTEFISAHNQTFNYQTLDVAYWLYFDYRVLSYTIEAIIESGVSRCIIGSPELMGTLDQTNDFGPLNIYNQTVKVAVVQISFSNYACMASEALRPYHTESNDVNAVRGFFDVIALAIGVMVGITLIRVIGEVVILLKRKRHKNRPKTLKTQN